MASSLNFAIDFSDDEDASAAPVVPKITNTLASSASKPLAPQLSSGGDVQVCIVTTRHPSSFLGFLWLL
jgi:hypothetical protein